MKDKVFPFHYSINKASKTSAVKLKINSPLGWAELELPLGETSEVYQENEKIYHDALRSIVYNLSEYLKSEPPFVPKDPPQ